MTDRIRLRGVSVHAVVGVRDDEREAPRELLLDVTLEVDTERSAITDDLADTVDYDALTASIRRAIEARAPKLIETAAEVAAQVCLANRLVAAAEVVVHKPGAVGGVADVAVSVRRTCT